MIKFCCECEFTHMALGCHVQSGDDVRAWALGCVLGRGSGPGSGPGLWAGFWVGALSWGSGPGLAGPVRGRQQLSPGTRPDCVLSQLVELQVSRGGYRAFSFSLSCIVVLCDFGKKRFWDKEMWMHHTLASWPACLDPAGAAVTCPLFSSQVAALPSRC